MTSWKAAFGQALVTGTTASLLSAAMLALCGRIVRGTAAGPNNGPSQWVWGENAAYERRATLRNTALGYAIHHVMSIGWATLHEKHVVDPNRAISLPRRLTACAATSAFACFVDYCIAPRRLRPGFEKQLGKTSLFLVYAAFALGLAAGQRCAQWLLAAGSGKSYSGARGPHADCGTSESITRNRVVRSWAGIGSATRAPATGINQSTSPSAVAGRKLR
jgi:hypothetical protein